MDYFPLKRPRHAAIYIRSCPDELPCWDPDIQEELCRSYCTNNRIQVEAVYRETCDADASLERLRALLDTLPDSVDVLICVGFLVYSNRLRDLAKLCLRFEAHGIYLYSLDLPGRIWMSFSSLLTPKDHKAAYALKEKLEKKKDMNPDKKK